MPPALDLAPFQGAQQVALAFRNVTFTEASIHDMLALVTGLGGNKTVSVLLSRCQARGLQLALAEWVTLPAGASYSVQVREGGGWGC